MEGERTQERKEEKAREREREIQKGKRVIEEGFQTLGSMRDENLKRVRREGRQRDGISGAGG